MIKTFRGWVESSIFPWLTSFHKSQIFGLSSFLIFSAALYGNGVYFALQASYAARSTYSPPDPYGFRYMYLAKVLVGEYTVGRQGMLTPPVKNVYDVCDTYDTVVDNVTNPGIFVVFYEWQCYPEYLITFQWDWTDWLAKPRRTVQKCNWNISD